MLLVDEGVILHAYQDHLGYWTIGCGRLIDKRRGGGISAEEAMYLLNHDVDRVWAGLVKRKPWVEWLDPVRQIAVLNLAFNLGIDGLMQFVNTLGAMQRGDWKAAASGLRNSLWHRQVQRPRSARIVYMVEHGRWPPKVGA
jgi:lysozyme